MTELMASFLLAIAIVESGCNDNAIGKHGEVGRYQIRQCYLDDVNRIQKTSFVLEEMHNEKSAMFAVASYVIYYGTKYEERTGKKLTFEVMARIHNGGPRGYEKESTLAYWKKVKSVMEAR